MAGKKAISTSCDRAKGSFRGGRVKGLTVLRLEQDATHSLVWSFFSDLQNPSLYLLMNHNH